ncbi:MAG TPA: ABC transporter permease [Vicinamibacterales bacterium]|jgi:ABC-2 type transport system permease protein|nr:ABC transporter permease [Vicinamibacterales bacterium]
MRRIFYLAQAEILHVIRDRATLAQVLVVPLVQLIVLANAATFSVPNTPTWIVDLDRTPASRGLVNRMAASGNFDIVGTIPSTDAANEAMLHGQVTLVLTIPHDFEQSLVQRHDADVQLIVNAEKGSAAGIVQSYATAILNRYATELAGGGRLVEATPSRGGSTAGAPIEIRQHTRYNPTRNYSHYMVPGILVALVTIIGTLLTAQNIAREKELGTLEQLNVTPITRGQFIAGKLLPYWGLGLLELALGLTAGVLIFGVPVEGSLLLLFAVAAVYLLVALGIGLFISTIVHTQQQAMFVTFFIVNIYLLMSGLFTPIDSMAPWVQQVSMLNPVRHFVTISRAVLMKGAGPAEVAKPFAILAIFAVVVLTFAVRQYHKRTA